MPGVASHGRRDAWACFSLLIRARIRTVADNLCQAGPRYAGGGQNGMGWHCVTRSLGKEEAM
jgi:hypothetical protein